MPPTRVPTTHRPAASAAAATPLWLASRCDSTSASAPAKQVAETSASGTQRFSTDTLGRARKLSRYRGLRPGAHDADHVVAWPGEGQRLGQQVQPLIG